MVKKGIGMLLVFMLVFMLGACGSKEETRVFEMEEYGITTTITYYYEGDKVTKQTTKNTFSYESLGVSSKEEAKEIIDPLADLFQGIEGMTLQTDYGDSEVTETVESDYEKMDLEEAKDIPGMMITGDVSNGISMKKSADMLLDQGFKEK